MVSKHNGPVSSAASASTATVAAAAARRSRAKHALNAATVATLAATMLGSTVMAAHAAGGGGGTTGAGGGTAGNFATHYIMFDNKNPDNTPQQGYGQNSINFFFNATGPSDITGSPNAQEYMQTACTAALANADARRPAGTPAGQSRVVGMYWASAANATWNGYGVVNPSAFQSLYDEWVAASTRVGPFRSGEHF